MEAAAFSFSCAVSFTRHRYRISERLYRICTNKLWSDIRSRSVALCCCACINRTGIVSNNIHDSNYYCGSCPRTQTSGWLALSDRLKALCKPGLYHCDVQSSDVGALILKGSHPKQRQGVPLNYEKVAMQPHQPSQRIGTLITTCHTSSKILQTRRG